jgi:pilus assembly protein CpaB
MNRRILIIVSCAFVLSVCASYLVYRALGARSNPAKGPAPTQIVTAARNLEPGTLIQAADLKNSAWIGPLPNGASAKLDGFLNRGVLSAIYESEPVTESRLAPKGSGGGLAATIPPGMRACAVKVDEVVGVAGFVVSGMRVDVLVTGVPPGGNPLDGPRVRTLLENLLVLSAGTNFQKDREGKPEPAQVVNLLVTPEQAEILSLASVETRIRLILRNPMDNQISKPPGVEMSELFGRSSTPQTAPSSSTQSIKPVEFPAPVINATPAPPARAIYVIEVTNGATHTQATFSRAPGGKQ